MDKNNSSTATGSASRAVRQVRSGGDGRDGSTGSGYGGSGSGGGHSTSSTASGKLANRGGGSSGGVIKFKTSFRNTIYDTMLRRGWKETNENDWDFYWADREYIYDLLDSVHLENNQRVNHYRNGREVSNATDKRRTTGCVAHLPCVYCSCVGRTT